jgi:hypothetical protein
MLLLLLQVAGAPRMVAVGAAATAGHRHPLLQVSLVQVFISSLSCSAAQGPGVTAHATLLQIAICLQGAQQPGRHRIVRSAGMLVF